MTQALTLHLGLMSDGLLVPSIELKHSRPVQLPAEMLGEKIKSPEAWIFGLKWLFFAVGVIYSRTG
jgi:hypothetical protein